VDAASKGLARQIRRDSRKLPLIILVVKIKVPDNAVPVGPFGGLRGSFALRCSISDCPDAGFGVLVASLAYI